MREIREYNMNGTIILGVDNGYGNVKTAHRVFPTGIIKCDSEPVLSKEYIEYDGSYYIIGEGHKGFVADKQEDDDTYILTLAAIAKELEARGLTETRIHLAVGLPLKWVQAQRESFKKYLTRERYVSLKYKKVDYLIEIVDCTVMPQGYAAVAENLKDFKGMNLLVDVGNGTMNVMYLNNGRPIESKSWTEKLGVNQCFIRIQNRIMDRTGTKLPDEIINDFLRYGDADVSEAYLSAMKQVAEQYVQGLFQKFYFTDGMKMYSDKIAKFVCRCEKETKGRVSQRISRIYPKIYVDEIQDLAGYDLDIIKSLLQAECDVTMVGDPRQVTYHTHNEAKYKKYANGKIEEFIKTECKKPGCIIDKETLNDSYRNNQSICSYSSQLYEEYGETGL